MDEIGLVAFSDITHYEIDTSGNVKLAEGAPPGAMRAVSSIKKKVTQHTNTVGRQWTTTEVELRLWPKTAALQMAGMVNGLLREGESGAGLPLIEDIP
jgi:hypothetical protein